jgi:hypothetical protein
VSSQNGYQDEIHIFNVLTVQGIESRNQRRVILARARQASGCLPVIPRFGLYGLRASEKRILWLIRSSDLEGINGWRKGVVAGARERKREREEEREALPGSPASQSSWAFMIAQVSIVPTEKVSTEFFFS